MNVLWFSLSPCGALRRNHETRVIQGWMLSLEDEVKRLSEIKLSVAFFSSTESLPFTFDNVTYYPIYDPIPKNSLCRVIKRWQTLANRDMELLPKMLDVVQKSAPDLIHIHGTEQSFGLIQDYIKDIPIVFSIQGLIAPYTEKFFSGIPEKYTGRYESWSEKIRAVSSKNQYDSFVQKGVRECHYLKYAQYIFGRTFWDREITGLLNSCRKYYVIDEIMRPQFYEKKWVKLSYEKRLKIVSTISGGIYKGYETALKTASLLKSYAPFEFEWHIVGYDRKMKWVRIAERMLRLNSVDCNMVFHGRLDADKLAELLVESDVYAHVSHIENSPNSVCEAMLVGMPIIASFTGGTCSLLENEKEGLLVQDGDPYVLAGAILRVQQNFEQSQFFGDNARKTALQRHNPQRIVNELIRSYSDILKFNSVDERKN